MEPLENASKIPFQHGFVNFSCLIRKLIISNLGPGLVVSGLKKDGISTPVKLMKCFHEFYLGGYYFLYKRYLYYIKLTQYFQLLYSIVIKKVHLTLPHF